MLMFALAISCLTTSNLPGFMGLTFQVPMQYWSLQHWTLLPSPVTSTTNHTQLVPSLHSFWSYLSTLLQVHIGHLPNWGVHLSVSYLFAFSFSRQEYRSGFPFPSPVDHILSELFTMTRPSWVALHSIAHSFIELDKAVVHAISLICFLWLWFLFYLPSDREG